MLKSETVFKMSSAGHDTLGDEEDNDGYVTQLGDLRF